MNILEKLLAEHDRVSAVQNEWAQNQSAKAEALRNRAIESAQRVEEYKSTLPGRLGLDPLSDPFLHGVVNTGAKLLAGAGREIGNVAKAGYEASREASRDIPQNVRDAYNRELNGNASQEDLALLNSPASNVRNYRQEVQEWFKTRQGIQDIGQKTDLYGLVDKAPESAAIQDLSARTTQALNLRDEAKQASLRGDKEQADFLASRFKKELFGSVSDFAIDNPSVVSGLVAENLPQLALGAVTGGTGTAVTAGGYAVDVKNKAIQEYIDKNNGQMPSEDEVNRIAALAAGAGSLEYVSDRLTLGAGKIAKTVAKAADEAVEGMGKGAFRTALGFANNVVNNPATRVAGGLGLAGAGEYVTEAAQTFLENEAERKPTTLEEMHVAGTMGFVGGVGGSAAVGGIATAAAAKDAYKGMREVAGIQREATAANEAEAAQVQAAADAGDVSVFLNRNSKTYSPDKAVGALKGMADRPDLTAQERTQYADQAKQVLDGFENEVARLKAGMGGDTQLQAELVQAEKDLAAIPADRTEDRAMAQELVDLLREEVKAGAMPAEELAAREAKLKELEPKLARAQAVYDALTKEAAAKPLADVNVGEVVATLTQAAPASQTPEDQAQQGESVKKLRLLSMASFGSVSAEQAKALSTSTNTALSQEDKQFFQDYAKVAEITEQFKKMPQVLREVAQGDRALDQKGLEQYQERFGVAYARQDIRRMAKEVQGLTAFKASHDAKLDALKQAYSQAMSSGQTILANKNADGKWTVAVAPEKYKRKAGEYLIETATGKGLNSANKLIGAVRLEAMAMTATMDFMANYGQPSTVAPSATPVTSTANVVPAANVTTAPIAQNQQTEVSAPVEAAATAGVSETTPVVPEPAVQSVPGAGTPGPVEAVGVTPTAANAAVSNEQQRNSVEKARRKLLRNKGASLWTAIKHTLSENDLSDIYGSEWKKRFTMLRGKPGADLSTAVRNGALNEFLPFELRFADGYTTDPALEQDAVEYVKDKLRNRNYLSYETQVALDQLNLELDYLDEVLSDQDLSNLESYIESLPDEQTADTETAAQTQTSEVGSGQAAQEVEQRPAEGNSGNPQSEATTDESLNRGLTALQDTHESTQFLRDNLQQSSGSEQGTQRPLVLVRDFFQKLRADVNVASQYLKDGLSGESRSALRYMVQVGPKWMGTLQSKLKRGPLQYAWNNVAEHFMGEFNGKLDFEENVKTAAVVAALSAVMDMNGRGTRNTDDAIRSLANLEDEDYVSPQLRRELMHVGTRRATAANALGKKMVQALGLKAKADAPANVMIRLESSLGAYALTMMIKEGVLEAKTINGAEWYSLMHGVKAQESDKNFYSDQQFVRLARLPRQPDTLAPAAANAVAALKGSGNVVEKLFGVEAAVILPTFEAQAYQQKTVQKGQTPVPAELAKVLSQKNQEGNFLRLDMFTLMDQMDEDLFLQIMGTEDVQKLHINQRISARAQNDNLLRDYLDTLEFIQGAWQEQGWEVPIYLQHVVWKNQRVGIENTVLNPQTSKLARHLLTRESWKTQVNPLDDASLDNFKLRVLEAFGVKTDKQINAVSLASWKAKIEDNAAVQAAVQSLVDVRNGLSLSREQQENIAAVVKKGGEKMRTLDALKALADLKLAGNESFESDLVGEVDGVTNGPMLTNLLMGAADHPAQLFRLLQKGGFYPLGDNNQFSNYNSYRSSEGAMDLYETVMSQVLGALNRNGGLEQYPELWAFTGDMLTQDGKVASAGRKLIKRPVTALHFGSAPQATLEGMAGDFLETVFDRIAEYAREGKDVTPLIRHLNTMLAPTKTQIPLQTPAEALLERPFNDRELRAIQNHFIEVMEAPLVGTLKSYFKPVLARKRAVNSAAGMAFGLYNGVYLSVRQEYLKELAAAGEIQTNNKGEPLWDLSTKQDAEIQQRLKKLMPVMHTAMSLYSKQAEAGLSVSKSRMKLSGHRMHHSIVRLEGEAKGQGTVEINGEAMVNEGPGVAPFSVSIHSFDSAVSHMAAAMSEALNIHDAHVTGLGNYTQVAQNLNQSLWQMALNYSPAQAVRESLESTIIGLADLMNNSETDMTPVVNSVLWQMMYEEDQKRKTYGLAPLNLTPMQYLGKKLNEVTEAAYSADQIRLGALAQMAYIDQYALEGGQYEVTDADRQAAQAKLDALQPGLSNQVLSSLKTLREKLDGNSKKAADVTVDESFFPDDLEPSSHVLGMPNAQAKQLLAQVLEAGQVPENIRDQVFLLNNLLYKEANQTEFAELVQREFDAHEVAVLAKYLNEVAYQAAHTPFGPLGDPVVEPEADVQALLESQPQQPVESLITGLRNLLKEPQNNAQSQFYSRLLAMSLKALPKGVTVQYVTPQTQPKEVAFAADSRGWYDRDAMVIYVLSPDFVASGLTAETLVHEVVHAAIEHILDNPQTPAQKEAVAELNTLLGLAQQHVAQNGLSQYQAAVSNLHELTAWGMTNPGFQKDVLLKLKMQSKTKLDAVMDGLKALANGLVKLLFPNLSKPSATDVDGFSALVTNVTLLYAGAEQANRTKVANAVSTIHRTLSHAAVPPTHYTTQQVFEAMSAGQDSQEHTEKLQSLLNDVVNRISGAAGALKARMEKTVGTTAMDAWANAEARGERVFHAKVLSSGVQFSEQSGYVAEQMEAVLSTVFGDKSSVSSVHYREMEKVFDQAREALRGKIDPDLYKFVFQAQPGMGNKSDYMQRFVTLALTHEGFAKSMQFETRRADLVLKGKTFMQRIEAVWRAAVDWIGAKMAGTYLGQRADFRVEALMRKLVQIEARNKDKIGQRSMLDFLEPLESRVTQASNYVREKAVAAAGSKFVKENSLVLVNVAGKLITSSQRVDQIIDGVNKMAAKANKGKPNQAIQFLNYLKGPGEWMNMVLRETKRIEAERKHITHDVAKAVLAGFENNGAYLTDKQKAALSAVLLRTGATNLIGTYTLADLQSMLENPKQLEQAIQKEIGALSHMPEVHYYVAQAKGLGWKLVTGWAGVARQNLNAHNIAQLYNSGHPSPANASAAIPHIERLISLYGLAYSEENQVNDLLTVMRIEAARGADNGVQTTVSLYQKMAAEAKEKLFSGSEALMMHGYLPEIHNPNVAFKVVRESADAKELEELGYVLETVVPTDKNDPDQRPVMMYVIKGAGLPRWNSGAFSTTGTKARGTLKHGAYFNEFDPVGVENMQSIQSIFASEQAEVDGQFKPNPRFKPKMENRLVPLLNARGTLVDYRYQMKEHMRNKVLERDNRFEHLMGVMKASTYDKVESRVHNEQLVSVLHEMYKADFKNQPEDFVMVGAKSSDPELAEIWKLLPDKTKLTIEKTFGQRGMYVRKEMVLPLFGYRKASLASLFEKDEFGNTWEEKLQKMFVEFSTWLVERYAIHGLKMDHAAAKHYAKRTQTVVRRAEDMWQEVVQEMKDAIVVKTVNVLWGNITSNFTVLIAQGLPIHKVFSYQMEGLKAVMDYTRDRDALAQVKLRAEITSPGAALDALLSEQAKLEDALARNPAYELVEAGMLPTIVEDVNMEDNPYSYKSNLVKRFEAKTQGVNRHVRKAAEMIYMKHDTVPYKFLSKSTQYSDFVARYALYKHETTKKNPVEKQKALFNASEAFVNYDVPMPKHLQYLDDHGFMNFVKYFFSIQRVIARLVKDKPLHVLNMLAMNHMVGDLPMVLDSSVLVRIGNNPFSMGAVGIVPALGSLPAVEAGTGLFK